MRSSMIYACAGVIALSLPVGAQAPAAKTILPPDQQIAAAVSAAPAELRASATVLGYDASKKLVKLREGTGDMVCLANNPDGEQFHVACYHKLLEPFMARGRALRAEGVKDPQRDSVRFREIKSGALKMPSTPSALYTLTGPPKSVDATGAKWLYVVYIPGATTASTGITEKPAQGVPWIMFPGTPKAHIMFFTGM